MKIFAVDPLVFIVSLAVLIFIHELGHFLTAKKLGMYVEELAVGFPPRIFARKKKETQYSLNLLPVGGFVKIFGEQESDVDQLERSDPDYKAKTQKAFYNQPNWKRMIVLLAGVGMNFIFGWLIISLVFVRGVAVPGEEVKIVEIAKDSPAVKAGLAKDDKILKVGSKKILSAEDLVEAVNENVSKTVKLLVVRKDEQFLVQLVPREQPPPGQGAIGVVVTDFVIKQYSIVQAPWLGLKESVRISKFFYREIFRAVGQLISGERPEIDVSGPVGIYSAYKESQGFFEKLLLTGLISLNLALINVLPFPALDGGHLLFVAIEGTTGRKVAARTKQRLTVIGLTILLGLVALVTVKDILQIIAE